MGLIKAKCGISRVLIGFSDGRTVGRMTSDDVAPGGDLTSPSRSSGATPIII